jgi:hypothetical protein
VTYAGFVGESVLLEAIYKRGIAAPEIAPDLHATDDGLLMFWSTKPVAPWQDERWLRQMRATMRPNAFARLIENKWVSSESAFVDMAWFDACVCPAMHPILGDRSMSVWIGIDASVKRDSTAIVCCTTDGTTVRLICHRIFQPSATDPLDFERTVEATVKEWFARFSVAAVLYDPYQMQAVAQRLEKAGVPMHEFPQTVGNLTAASTNLYELIKGSNLAVYPDADIRLAISRAIAKESSRGWKIAKEKQSHKIDVVVALAQAAYGALHVPRNSADSWNEYMRRQLERLNSGVDHAMCDVDDIRAAADHHGWKFHDPADWCQVILPPGPIAQEGRANVGGVMYSASRWNGANRIADIRREHVKELMSRPAWAEANPKLAAEFGGAA